MIAVHVGKNSPKKPDAKLSIYLQRRRQGITWGFRGHAHGIIRFRTGEGPVSDGDLVRWVRLGFFAHR